MSSHENSNTSDNGSVNHSEASNRPRPSLFPLRNSAKRRSSLLDSMDIFNPHKQIQQKTVDRLRQNLGRNDDPQQQKQDIEFQYRSPAHLTPSSPRTPLSTSKSRKVPKQFEFDTPYVPFVHQPINRQHWKSQEIIAEQKDAELQKKMSQNKHEEDFQEHCDENIRKVEEESKRSQVMMPDESNQDIEFVESNKAIIISEGEGQEKNMEIMNSQEGKQIEGSVRSGDVANLQEIKEEKSQNSVKSENCPKINSMSQQSKIQQCHEEIQTIKKEPNCKISSYLALEIKPTLRTLTQCQTPQIMILPSQTVDQCWGSDPIKTENKQTQRNVKLEFASQLHSFNSQKQFIPIEWTQIGKQTDTPTLRHQSNIVSFIFSGLNKQYVNMGSQFQAILCEQASMQTNNKVLQIHTQDCAKFDMKYGYEEYLQKRFKNFMDLIELKFQTQTQVQQKHFEEQAKKLIMSHEKPSKKYVDTSTQYDYKESNLRPSLKRVSIFEPRISADSYSTEEVVLEEKQSQSRRSQKNTRSHKSPEKGDDPSQYLPMESKRALKSKKKTGKTPNKKKKSKK